MVELAEATPTSAVVHAAASNIVIAEMETGMIFVIDLNILAICYWNSIEPTGRRDV